MYFSTNYAYLYNLGCIFSVIYLPNYTNGEQKYSGGIAPRTMNGLETFAITILNKEFLQSYNFYLNYANRIIHFA